MKRQEILSWVGLKARMDTAPESKYHFDEEKVIDRSVFETYSSNEYRGSQIVETDEAFGFYNTVLLHKESGLRFEYAVYENYYGDAEYKLLHVFIKTNEMKILAVLDFDIEKKQVVTPYEVVPFSDLKKDTQWD